jgi:hypothetical protein
VSTGLLPSNALSKSVTINFTGEVQELIFFCDRQLCHNVRGTLFPFTEIFIVSMKSLILNTFLAYIPHFEKKNESKLIRSPCCLFICIYIPPLLLLLGNGLVNLFPKQQIHTQQ